MYTNYLTPTLTFSIKHKKFQRFLSIKFFHELEKNSTSEKGFFLLLNEIHKIYKSITES